jgi:hypothetical protein
MDFIFDDEDTTVVPSCGSPSYRRDVTPPFCRSTGVSFRRFRVSVKVRRHQAVPTVRYGMDDHPCSVPISIQDRRRNVGGTSTSWPSGQNASAMCTTTSPMPNGFEEPPERRCSSAALRSRSASSGACTPRSRLAALFTEWPGRNSPRNRSLINDHGVDSAFLTRWASRHPASSGVFTTDEQQIGRPELGSGPLVVPSKAPQAWLAGICKHALRSNQGGLRPGVEDEGDTSWD